MPAQSLQVRPDAEFVEVPEEVAAAGSLGGAAPAVSDDPVPPDTVCCDVIRTQTPSCREVTSIVTEELVPPGWKTPGGGPSANIFPGPVNALMTNVRIAIEVQRIHHGVVRIA
jgi:hypothetical protein